MEQAYARGDEPSRARQEQLDLVVNVARECQKVRFVCGQEQSVVIHSRWGAGSDDIRIISVSFRVGDSN